VISVLIEIAMAYLSHNCPYLLRVPYLNVECFVQLGQQMRKFPVLRVFTRNMGSCRFQPSFVPATVPGPGCPHAREKTIFLDTVIYAWQPGGSTEVG
jgi:hypothetical protein